MKERKWFRTAFVLVAALGMALAPLACEEEDPDPGDPTPGAPYTPCMSNEDCNQQAGEICDMSECRSCCPEAGEDEVCIAACCGACVPDDGRECSSDSDCQAGKEWCEGGRCVPCDNTGATCGIRCPMVPPRNGCQPCECVSYRACTGHADCNTEAGEVCDLSECLSCCPDAGPDEPCILLCCGRCTAGSGGEPACQGHEDCVFGAEWCLDGTCVPCDNTGLTCGIRCPLVEPINGCQPCQCDVPYVPCQSDADCQGGRCDRSECRSCCPDAPPGSACIAVCCGACVF